MKKQIIILMFAVLLVGYATAGISTFNNLDDAREHARDIMDAREDYANSLRLEYEYTTDKTCKYLYDYNDFICSICFDITQPIKESDCIYLSTDSTREEDDLTIRNYIKNKLTKDYYMDDVNINLRDETGRRL